MGTSALMKLKKLAVATSIAVAASVTAAFGQTGTPNTDWYGDGSATTFYIASPDQLAGLAKLVNEGTDDFVGKTVTLTADVDLGADYGASRTYGSASPDGDFTFTGWEPIGKLDDSYWPPRGGFAGTFDGGGKTISGLYIDRTSGNSGLFGFVNGREAYKDKGNVGDRDENGDYCYSQSSGSCTYRGPMGMPCDFGNWDSYPVTTCDDGSGQEHPAVTATIKNVRITDAEIKGGWNTGGIAGRAYGNVNIKDSYVLTGTISGGEWGGYVGGIVGSMEFGDNGSGGLANCYSGATVNGYQMVGGVAGNFASNGSGNVSLINCYSTGAVSGNHNVGGVAGGVTGGYGDFTLSGCYSTSAVVGSGSGSNIGGLFGTLNYYGSSGSVTGNAALNPSVTGENSIGRMIGNVSVNDPNIFSKNYAFNGMIGTFNSSEDIEFITRTEINEDGTIKGLFTQYPSGDWLVAQGSLPYLNILGGSPLPMPAHLNPANVTVRFDLNGGVGTLLKSGVSVPVNGRISADEMPDFISGPFKNGFTTNSANWYFDKAGTSPFNPGSTNITRDTTLYLHWELNTTYYSSTFADGDGSPDRPYEINDPKQLAYVALMISLGDTDLASAHYRLIGDISLSTYGANFDNGNGSGWLPIGFNGEVYANNGTIHLRSTNNPFTGTFDGDGKKVTGLYARTSGGGVGLFGVVSGGTVKNIGVESPDVAPEGNNNVGGLVGRLENGGSVTACYVAGGTVGGGDVRGGFPNSDVGGIVGYVLGGSVTDCYSNVSVSGSQNVGGIVGTLANCGDRGGPRPPPGGGGDDGCDPDTKGRVENTYATGTVTTNNNFAGGIVGQFSSGVVKYNAALNPEIITGDWSNYIGRVVGGSYGGDIELSNNVAFTGMAGAFSDPDDKGNDKNNGADISRQAIATDGTINGLFTQAPSSAWAVNDGQLPGLAAFGGARDMPLHLDASEARVAFSLNGGEGTPPNVIIADVGHSIPANLKPPTNGFTKKYHTVIENKWFTVDGIEFIFGDGGTEVTDDMTLYLGWELDSRWFELITTGDGTELDPYIITTAKQLAYMAALVNDGDPAHGSGKHYKLNNDISIADYNANYNGGKGWMPVGDGVYRDICDDNGSCFWGHVSFQGVFDGNKKVITGLTIISGNSNSGLFGMISGGTVKNLGLANVSVSATNNVGGIAGALYDGATISNSYVAGGTVEGGGGVGGIAGYVSNAGIADCYTAVDVTGNSSGGAMGGGYNIGGIAGTLYYNQPGSKIICNYVGEQNYECYYDYDPGYTWFSKTDETTPDIQPSSVKFCYAVGAVSGNGGVGGIVGSIQGGTVTNNAALNPSITANANSNVGRIGNTYESNVFTNNVAFSDMTMPNHYAPNDGADTKDGRGLTKDEISGDAVDGSIGNIFTNAAIWKIAKGSLPGLFGSTVDMPDYLNADMFMVSFDLNDGGLGTPPAPIFVRKDQTIPADRMPPAVGFKPGEVTDGKWYTVDGTEFLADITPVTDNIILYLQWNAGIDVAWYDENLGGDGTENDPYIIANAKQLAFVALKVNEGNANYVSAHYRLGDDIDLSAPTNYGEGSAFNYGKGWIPIGTGEWEHFEECDQSLPPNCWQSSRQRLFKGTFDGDQKTVSGLYINDNQLWATGLFGMVEGGSISDIGVEGTVTGGSQGVGGVVGSISNGSVASSYFSGSVGGQSQSQVGGIVGSMNNSNVTNCYSVGTVSANGWSNQVGGVVGSAGNNSRVANSYSIADVTVSGSDFMIGGVVGSVHGATIEDNAALNPRVANTGWEGGSSGRVAGQVDNTSTLSGNIASGGINGGTNGFSSTETGGNTVNGEIVPRTTLFAGGDIGGLFGSSPPWTVADDRLPGLFGRTVEMPGHLEPTEFIVSFNLGGGRGWCTFNPVIVSLGGTVGYDEAFESHCIESITRMNFVHDKKWRVTGTGEEFTTSTQVMDDIELYLTWTPDPRWFDSNIAGGGTAVSPYTITNAKQLAYVALMVDEGNSPYATKHYELANDIDLSAHNKNAQNYNDGRGWLPIGGRQWNMDYSFRGVFDGKGNVISGLIIDNDRWNSMSGLFGFVAGVQEWDDHIGHFYVGGEIKNLAVIDADVIGNSNNIGIIAGAVQDGSVTRTYTSGTVGGREWSTANSIGGVVGSVSGTSTVSDNYSSATVGDENPNQQDRSGIGGIVGFVSGYSGTLTITNNYSVGVVKGAEFVGGVVGQIQSNGGDFTITDNAALNPSVAASNGNVGRVIGFVDNHGATITHSNNAAFDGMTITEGGSDKSVTSDADDIDGVNITRTAINSGDGIGGRFMPSVWTNAEYHLPYHVFALDMPNHLQTFGSATVVLAGSYPNYPYTGTQISPVVESVTLGGVTLILDTDYAVTYGTNVNVGPGTVNIIGIGTYVGEQAVKTFNIVPREQDPLIVTPVTDKTFGDDPFQLATTGGSGTGAVTFEVVSGPGTIAGNMLTITGAGNIVVKATKAADANHLVAISEEVTIVVAKAAQDALVVTPVIGKTYGDAAFALTTSGGSGTGAVTFELVDGTAATVTSVGLVTITGAGSIVVKATKAADANYLEAVSAEATIVIDKAPGPSAPAAPTLASKTHNSVTLTPTAGHEYRMNDGAWTTNNVFGGLTPNTLYSFYQRVAATANVNASGSSEKLDVTTDAPPAALTGTATISNTAPRIGDVLTGSLTGGNNTGALTYTWKADGTAVGTNAATYTVVVADLGKVITLEITSSVETGTRMSAATAAVLKKVAPTAPAAPTVASKTHNSVTLTPTAGHEYRMGDDGVWTTNNVFGGLTSITAYTFYQRVAETADTEASGASPALNVTTAPATFTVTWNADGGTPAPTQTSVTQGGEITAPEAMTKTGYTFGGWYSDAALTIAVTFPIANITANTTLYAKWTINTYTVTWNADGGTPVPTQTSVNHGSSITAPAAMTKVGYTFGGWYSDAALTIAVTFPIADVTANTTLYAKWVINTYTVTWNADGGTPVPAQVSVNHGSSITAPAAMTKTGFTFVGWYSDAALTTAVTFPIANITANTTLYAKWEAVTVTEFTVTLAGAANGAGAGSYAVGATVIVSSGSAPAGMRFVKWESSNTSVVFANAHAGKTSFVMPDNDVTITATWEENKALLKAGPNTLSKSARETKIYYEGESFKSATLNVYDAMGNVVRKLTVTDRSRDPGVSRVVGAWDLKDIRGNKVGEGAYLIRGVITTTDGNRVRVSEMVVVR